MSAEQQQQKRTSVLLSGLSTLTAELVPEVASQKGRDQESLPSADQGNMVQEDLKESHQWKEWPSECSAIERPVSEDTWSGTKPGPLIPKEKEHLSSMDQYCREPPTLPQVVKKETVKSGQPPFPVREAEGHPTTQPTIHFWRTEATAEEASQPVAPQVIPE